MTRHGASTREYSRNDDDADTYHPRHTSDRASARIDSTRQRTTFHSTATPSATSDDDESAYGGHRQHHRGVARDIGNGGTRRRREDPVIEQLRREVREDEARRSGGEDYSYDDDDDEDDDFALPRRTVMPRGGARATGGVRAGAGDGNGNGGTHGRRDRRRREDPVIERLHREVREDEARLSGSRGTYSDDCEGETGFRREVGAGRCGNGNGGRRSPRGHFYESEDDGVEGGRRGAFCGGWGSRVW